MADTSIGPGTVLAGRFRLDDLLSETKGAKFWRATDRVLARSVAVNVIPGDDQRGPALLQAARTSATVTDGHFLRVLDAARENDVVYVVNEWGSGLSLDLILAEGPLAPRRAAWLVKEVADAIATAHRHGIAHGRLIPENVIVNEAGAVKLIGFVVDAVLAGRREPPGPGAAPVSDHESDVVNLASLLYATLVGRWPGPDRSKVPAAPLEHGLPLRPRRVRAGVPRPLDAICERVLNTEAHQHHMPIETAHEIAAALSDFIGDPTGAQLGQEPTSVLRRQELEQGLTEPGEETGRAEAPGGDPDQPTLHGAPNPAGAAGAGAAGAAVGLAGATAAWQAGDERDDPPTRAEPTTPADTASHEPAPPGPEPAQGAEPRQQPEPEHQPEPSTDPDPPKGSGRPRQDPEATVAGTPVFYDDDSGIGWAAAGERGLRRAEEGHRTPPPPPPEPEPKPLFAPDPAGGRAPSRRARGHDGPTGAHRGDRALGWAFDEDSDGPGSNHGTGSIPPAWGPDQEAPSEPDPRREHDAGKSWLRLAAIVAVGVVLVLAVIIAFNLGRGQNTDQTPAEQEPTADTSEQRPQPVQIAGVSDLDPEGDPPEENPETAALAIDGDPSTAWQTMTYFNNPRLGLLKDGVGLVVDLGEPVEVDQVELRLQGSPTNLELLAAERGAGEPTDVGGLVQVGAAREGAGERVTFDPEQPVTTRYLVVWLTSLPPSDDGFQGRIAEIVVRS